LKAKRIANIKFSEETLRNFLASFALTLDHLEKNNIFIGKIIPLNIIVQYDENSADLHPVIHEYGLNQTKREMLKFAPNKSLTERQIIELKNNIRMNEKYDIWSLGLVLLQMASLETEDQILESLSMLD